MRQDSKKKGRVMRNSNVIWCYNANVERQYNIFGDNIEEVEDSDLDEYTDYEEIQEVTTPQPATQTNPQAIAEKERGKGQDGLNYFAPTINLQALLKENWFSSLRSNAIYNEPWTDGFIKELMASEWKDCIAEDWAVKGARSKHRQIKGYVIGLLRDAGVLKGSYNNIAKQAGITEDYHSFARYMGDGKKQPYADWVMQYVSLHDEGF